MKLTTMKKNLPAIAFTPPKMKTKKVWIGSYGGHYSQVVLFSKKPIPSKEEHNHISGEWYDCLDNKNIIVGDCGLEEFKAWFKGADLSFLEPDSIDITKVFEISIKAVWDEWKQGGNNKFKIDGISFSQNW